MAWFIGQSAVMIVLAFLLGLLLGWVIWHRRGNAAQRPVDEPTAEISYPEEPTAELPLSEQPDGEAGAAAPVEAEAGEAVAAESVTAALEEPLSEGPADAEAAPDDLARIEGIGPKISAALAAAGIRTYDRLASASLSDLQAATRTARITFTPSINSWSQQAALLAAGDEDGFKTLTDRLIAGREPGARLAGSEPEGAAEPEATAEPAPPIEPDALDRIEGIGPKISAALIASDIRTYRELADAQAPVLEEAINKAGIKFAPSIVTWSRQAALLAAGDEDGFRELTDQLVAGRDAARQA